MAVFLHTFEKLFPLYFFIALGALLARTGVLPKSMEVPLSRFIFISFISANLFVSVYQADLGRAVDARALVFAVISVLLQAVFGVWYAGRTVKYKPAASIVAQSFYRTNFGLHGLIYAGLLYGAESVGAASILIAATVPLYNILSVIIFEFMSGRRPSPKSMLVNVLKNPVVLSVSAALLLQLFQIRLPDMLMNPLGQLAAAGTPLPLIAAGAAMTFSGLRAKGRLVARAALIRLIWVPIVFIPAALLLGFRDRTLLSILVAFGGPVATPLPAMAFDLGGDGELAAQLVAVTLVLSLFTLHFSILLLEGLGFISF
ncbi:MAG TPA: hypothetical protein GX720_00365 [Clostridiaceae bacterium]|nr:hypothetical protein [Clostridiaceae bacterium]